MFGDSPASLGYLILWGLIATVAMTSILEGSRGLGLSRMSLPFLVGTFFIGNRRWALILGFVLYTIGGWLFAFLYYFLFASVGIYTWWFGAARRLRARHIPARLLRCRCCPLCILAWPRNITARRPRVSWSRRDSWR